MARRSIGLDRRAFLETFLIGAGGLTTLGAVPLRALAAPVSWHPPRSGLMFGEDPTPGVDAGELQTIAEGTGTGWPSIARGADGTLWVLWTQMDGDEERIHLGRLGAQGVDGFGPIPFSGTTSAALAYQPQLVVTPRGLLALWAAGGAIQSLLISPGAESLGAAPVRTLAAGQCRRPCAVATASGTVVAWEERVDGKFAIRAAMLSDEGDLRVEPFALSTFPDRDCRRPALAVSPHGDEIAFAFDSHDGPGTHNVHAGRLLVDGLAGFAREPRRTHHQITHHPASDIAPALAHSLDGKWLWIGWHSNRRGEAEWDIPRWFRLAAMSREDGALLQPATEPRDRDLDKRDTDQSFEFVRLVALPDGGVVIIGRPSHNWCLQVFRGDGWSPLYRLPADGWGGRGKLACAVLDGDNALWIARRDLLQNAIQRIAGLVEDDAAEPALVPLDEPRGRTLVGIATPLPFPPETQGDASAEAPLHFYFGDIHAHTWMSDGMGDVDEHFLRNRDVFRHDFAALTDHDNFVGKRLLNSEYEEHLAEVEHFNEPGRFVTLFAQEWTTPRTTSPNGYGHMNFYGVTPDHPLFDHLDERWNTQSKVNAAAKAHGLIGVPHHIGWTGVRWDEIDPEVTPVVEICSVHGAFEHLGNEPIPHRGGMEGCFVQDGLARGLKFGLVGGSDQHGLIYHHGVCWKRDAYCAGLTGVLAPELTREAIFAAIRARRTFATTGVRLRMGFKVNGALMGSEIDSDGPPEIAVDVIAEGDLRWLEVVRNGATIHRWGGEGVRSFYSFTDDACPVGETAWYYLRVILESGDMGWSSPIWVTRRA